MHIYRGSKCLFLFCCFQLCHSRNLFISIRLYTLHYSWSWNVMILKMRERVLLIYKRSRGLRTNPPIWKIAQKVWYFRRVTVCFDTATYYYNSYGSFWKSFALYAYKKICFLWIAPIIINYKHKLLFMQMNFKSFCLFRPTVGDMTCESFIRDTAEKNIFYVTN